MCGRKAKLACCEVHGLARKLKKGGLDRDSEDLPLESHPASAKRAQGIRPVPGRWAVVCTSVNCCLDLASPVVFQLTGAIPEDGSCTAYNMGRGVSQIGYVHARTIALLQEQVLSVSKPPRMLLRDLADRADTRSLTRSQSMCGWCALLSTAASEKCWDEDR